jgi:hypothetical protein
VSADLTKVAMWALTNRHSVYIEYCTGPIAGLIGKAIEGNTPDVSFEIREAFKNLQSIAFMTHLAVSGGLISGTSAEFTAGKEKSAMSSYSDRRRNRPRKDA